MVPQVLNNQPSDKHGNITCLCNGINKYAKSEIDATPGEQVICDKWEIEYCRLFSED